MAAGPDHAFKEFLLRLGAEWICTEPEHIGSDSWAKFCGFELGWGADRKKFFVAKPAYISERTKRHEVSRTRVTPFCKPQLDDDPEAPTPEQVREAQALVGEILSVSVRARPDLSPGVSWMWVKTSRNVRPKSSGLG